MLKRGLITSAPRTCRMGLLPPSCRAVLSLRHLVCLTILGSSIPFQILPSQPACLPAGGGPERDHAQRCRLVVTL